MLRGATTSHSTPLKLSARPNSPCVRTSASNLQGRLPVLRRVGERPEWDVYLHSVYGDVITYPVDLSAFSWFYTNKLPLNGVRPDQLGNKCAPRHLHA